MFWRKRETHECPRRVESPMASEMFPPPDTWERRTWGGSKTKLPVCSYCGSVRPDVFMEKMRAGWICGPTDKNYKAYLGQPTDEGAEWPTEGLANMVQASRDVGKFYYRHLSEEQMREFVAMLNRGEMKVGYPGNFYVLPFFCGR